MHCLEASIHAMLSVQIFIICMKLHNYDIVIVTSRLLQQTVQGVLET